jgi:hypothetical protein
MGEGKNEEDQDEDGGDEGEDKRLAGMSARARSTTG